MASNGPPNGVAGGYRPRLFVDIAITGPAPIFLTMAAMADTHATAQHQYASTGPARVRIAGELFALGSHASHDRAVFAHAVMIAIITVALVALFGSRIASVVTATSVHQEPLAPPPPKEPPPPPKELPPLEPPPLAIVLWLPPPEPD